METINHHNHAMAGASSSVELAFPLASGPVAGGPGAWQRLQDRFELITSQAKIAGKTLLIPELADPLTYIQQSVERESAEGEELPYWTKLWPAALVLAGLTAGLEPAPWVDPDEPILELGAGMGLPGLAAALSGRRVVLTDIHPDALEFARAAVELNHLEDKVEVRLLDWLAPSLELGRFHTILGAEILYHRHLYPHLAALLRRLLKPGGTAIISHQERPFKISFFDLLDGHFERRGTLRKVHTDEGEVKVYLHALKLLD
jgi:2-polyprenyl-3-methyl-5-hydroxy-6-metoxy-1,4-benzoquinol methylase